MPTSTTGAAGVVVSELSKSFGSLRALQRIELNVASGEFFALLGPSGCGKTTLMRAIAGLINPEEGRIDIGGQSVVDASRRRFLAPDQRQLGMVFQDYALWPHMRVSENVAFPLQARKAPRAVRAERVSAALHRVGLDHLAHRFPAELSGGQQQRVAVARAIVAAPKVLLFDEPLSNLDANLRDLLGHELAAVARDTGATSIYVTHDQTEALSLADRVAVMRDGAILQLDTPVQLYQSPSSAWIARFLNAGNLLPGTIGSDGFKPQGTSLSIALGPGLLSAISADPTNEPATLLLPATALRVDAQGNWPLIVQAAHFRGDRFQIVANWGAQGDAPAVNFWHHEALARHSIVPVSLDQQQLRLFSGADASFDQP